MLPMLLLQILTVIPVTVAYLDLSNINDTRYHLVTPNRLTLADARARCQSLGVKWGLPDFQDYRSDLVQYMTREHLTSVWMALSQTKYGRWLWVQNNTQYNGDLINDPGLLCGGIAVEGMKMQSMNCAEGGNGFVCQMPRGTGCPERFLSQACMEYKGIWYLIGCKSNSWYHAKAYCLSRGGNLAKVQSKAERHHLLNYVVEKKLFAKCGYLYIGLRQEDWWITRYESDSEAPEEVFWAAEQPRSNGLKCAVLKLTNNNDYEWVATLCEETSNVICQNYGYKASIYRLQSDLNISEPVSKRLDINPNHHFDNNNAWFISLTILTSLAWIVVCIGLMLTYKFLKRLLKRYNQASKNRSEESDKKSSSQVEMESFNIQER